jgi:hypothetical protein
MKIFGLLIVLGLSACAKSEGSCGNCGTYPHPNATLREEVISSCKRQGVPLNGSTAYVCHQFSPACTVVIQDAPLNEPLNITSTCPNFP